MDKDKNELKNKQEEFNYESNDNIIR